MFTLYFYHKYILLAGGGAPLVKTSRDLTQEDFLRVVLLWSTKWLQEQKLFKEQKQFKEPPWVRGRKAMLWIRIRRPRQCCGTAIIFVYGSGSDVWQVPVTVPVSAPYLDHKKQNFQKIFWKNLVFFFFFPFLAKFNKIIVKCEWKYIKWRKSNTQYYTV